MKNLWLMFLLLLINLAPGVGVLQAEIYKWVDEQGNTHYGERPPQYGNANEVTIRKGPSAPDPVLERHRQRQQKFLDVLQQEREEKKAKQNRKRREREEREMRCYRSKDELETYRSAGSLYEYDGQGNKVYLNDVEREKAIKRVEEDVRRYCK